MKKLINNLLFSKKALAVFTAFSAVSVLFFYSVRYGYVFVDNALYSGFSLGLFVFVVLSAVCLLILLNLKVRQKLPVSEKGINAIALVCEALSIIAFLYSIITLITDDFMSLSSALYLGAEAFPVWSLVVGVAFSPLYFRL